MEFLFNVITPGLGGIFFILIGFRIITPSMRSESDREKLERYLILYKIAGFLMVGWAVVQLAGY